MPVKLSNTEFQTLTATLLNQLHALINFAKIKIEKKTLGCI